MKKALKIISGVLLSIIFIILLLITLYSLLSGGWDLIVKTVKEIGFLNAVLEFFKRLFTLF